MASVLRSPPPPRSISVPARSVPDPGAAVWGVPRRGTPRSIVATTSTLCNVTESCSTVSWWALNGEEKTLPTRGREEGPVSQPRSGPTVALRCFGADLRRRREAAGMTLQGVAETIKKDRATPARWENAETVPNPRMVAVLLDLYSTPAAERTEVLRALEEAKKPGWWHPWREVAEVGVIDLESAATGIRSYAPGVLPDLLQTTEYAEALMSLRNPYEDPAVRRLRLELLEARKAHSIEGGPGGVANNENRAGLWVLLEQATLRRRVGGPGVMTRQLDYLEAHIADVGSSVAIQVIPPGVPHPLAISLCGHLEILRFKEFGMGERLIQIGLHPAMTLITDDSDAVENYRMAMDVTSGYAPPRFTPLPLTSKDFG
ncbi:helix-turn-helix domain-containing protein [Streptomyces niveus]|uniref:helix-turn-helix domain-containing protein n=1 Tax=Streptomyces niveus TaxID=193462 RepID=UPI00364C53B1